MTSLIYLHGFGDGPDDLKGRHCSAWAESHDIVFQSPDLNLPTFESLTIGAQVDAVEKLVQRLEAPAVLVGSSLGGLVAVAAIHRAVAHHSSQLKSLILLAPAFGFARRCLSSDRWAAYRLRGNLPFWHSSMRRLVRLGPELLEDVAAWSDDNSWRVAIPAFVLHGRRDEVVPVEESEAFVDRHPNARLLILDDDHSLSAEASMNALSGILTEAFDGPAR